MRALRRRYIRIALILLILPLALRLPAWKADTSALTDRCHNEKIRNTSTANSLIGRDQIVFDLCAAALAIEGTESADPTTALHNIAAAGPELRKRFQGIAQEGRILDKCPTIRQSPTPAGDNDYLLDREYGCGPFHQGTRQAAPLDGHTVDVTNACSNYTSGRPNVSILGMHGPITAAQAAFDTCRAADLIAASSDTAQPASGETDASILQKLNYESFELVHCHYGSHPKVVPTSDPDYALDENPGCGQYEADIGS